MKIKEGFILREMCGEHIVAAEGLEHINFNKLIVRCFLLCRRRMRRKQIAQQRIVVFQDYGNRNRTDQHRTDEKKYNKSHYTVSLILF